MGALLIKRVYSAPADGDGRRILVDRLWPRGVKKSAVDEWARDAAPSAELRRSYGHDPERFGGFAASYRAELEKNAAAEALKEKCRGYLSEGNVTLLFAARDAEISNAAVLRGWLDEKLRNGAAEK